LSQRDRISFLELNFVDIEDIYMIAVLRIQMQSLGNAILSVRHLQGVMRGMVLRDPTREIASTIISLVLETNNIARNHSTNSQNARRRKQARQAGQSGTGAPGHRCLPRDLYVTRLFFHARLKTIQANRG
jgi:hypothetical protein